MQLAPLNVITANAISQIILLLLLIEVSEDEELAC
jgi:hypothetical protein